MARMRIIKKQGIYILSCVLLILVFSFMFESKPVLDINDTIQTKRTFENRHFKEKPVKKILIWTPIFQSSSLEGEKKCLETCDVRCVVTDDKRQVEDADAVDFHLSNIWTKEWRIGTRSVIKFPEYRTPDQVWIVSNLEPPPHLYGNIRILNGLFNWTKWYRQDADILWPYGEVYPYNKTEQVIAEEKLRGRNFFQEKQGNIVLRISNCFDPGRRYKFIQSLEKYVHVDKYGKCYHRACGDTVDPSDKTCSNTLRSYKFYLALENDICRDYVTEKYWFALQRDQIPIVNWRSVDPTTVIPNSYINIFDFHSVKHLANYIKQLSSNETLYNSYFEYKKKYTNKQESCVTCRICRALHDRTRPAQLYTDFDSWVQNDVCEKVGLWNNFLKNFYGWRFTILGF